MRARAVLAVLVGGQQRGHAPSDAFSSLRLRHSEPPLGAARIA